MSSAHFVFDKEDPLIDEIITIRVLGLVRKQKVTIKADITYGGYTYISYGCFCADDKGELDLSQCPSEAGSYTGLSPMGLFWSMEPAPGEPDGINLRSKKASFPFIYTLEAHDDHIDFTQERRSGQTEMCSAVIKRWYMAKDVQRVLVRSGRVRGALFLPPGPGPFPGVIDLFGSIGSIVDFRGALLASKGFAVLCLPYFAIDDLPASIYDVPFDYFMEAADWLSAHRSVIPDRLGVIGISKGGEIALQMAFYSNKQANCYAMMNFFKISGRDANVICYTIRTSKCLNSDSSFDRDKLLWTDEGLSFIHSFVCDSKDYLPLWEKDVNVLLVVGGDDQCVDPAILKQFQDRYPAHHKHKCERIQYDGAGHLIDPPYSPLFRKTERLMAGVSANESRTQRKVMMFWGGQKVQHAYAQEHSWNKIIQHFRKYLLPECVLPNCDQKNNCNRTSPSKL